MDQIAEVRLSFERGESKRSIARRCGLSRNTVAKILASDQTVFTYKPRERYYPALGDFVVRLEEILNANISLPAKNRLTYLQMYELLQKDGYRGGYDSVRRYASLWRKEHSSLTKAYIPLEFKKGEAFQFDWSEEKVKLSGIETKVYVAHICLCYSRMKFCMAFPRMTLEMVIIAHISAHKFFDGLCGIGIYDNLKAVVTKIGRGKEREYNPRFIQLASHYLFNIRACTPAAGWEKGQIERQVQTIRKRAFPHCPEVASFEELNAHLAEIMLQDARTQKHPDIQGKTIWEVYQEEKPFLRKQSREFDCYVSEERIARTDCLVNYDRNYYSVPCQYAGKSVTVRAYADKIVLAVKGQAVAEHKRLFQRGEYSFDFMHYLPLLERKPGALRNGQPFREGFPSALQSVWENIQTLEYGDRKMVSILSSIPQYGLEAVIVACETAMEQGVVTDVVILNYLSRLTEELPPQAVRVPSKLELKIKPEADCKRYDRLLGGSVCSVSKS